MVMNAPKVGGRAYARAAQRVKEKRVGLESPVHGLRKVSHDVRHVITEEAMIYPISGEEMIKLYKVVRLLGHVTKQRANMEPV